MLVARLARPGDISAIRRVFEATHGDSPTQAWYYDDALIARLICSSSTVVVVAEEVDTQDVVAVASVDMELEPGSDPIVTDIIYFFFQNKSPIAMCSISPISAESAIALTSYIESF